MTHEQSDPHGPHAPLRLITFGSFTLCNHYGQPLHLKDLSSDGPATTLLKALLCSSPAMESHTRAQRPGVEWEMHELSRDATIEAVWPDEQTRPYEADNSLNKAKSLLNKAIRTALSLSEDVVLFTGGSDKNGYQLNSRLVSSDADQFERLVYQACHAEDQGQEAFALWQEAYDLVQGEFLPHDLYADWAQIRRERLHARYRHCLHRLASHYAQQGAIDRALSLLHPYVIAHPADKDALCLLLPLLCQQERYHEVALLYQRYRRDLQEYGEEPSEAVTKLMAMIEQAHENYLLRLGQHTLAASAPFVIPSPGEMQPLTASPFDLKRDYVLAVTAQWHGRAAYCDALQAIIDPELRMLDKLHPLSSPESHILSRRQALSALLAIPPALLAAIQQPLPSVQVLEDFLPRCATGISACKQLMRGQHFFEAERALLQYLPLLEQLVEHPSHYQASALSLAAQGHGLLAIVVLHRLDMQGRIYHHRKAVEYSREYSKLTKDYNLHAIALSQLGLSYSELKNPSQAMPSYQEALQFEDILSPLARSNLYSRIAFAQAQLGHEQEARTYIDAAHAFFPDHLADDPSFLFTDADHGTLCIFDGWTYFALSGPDASNKEYVDQADQAYNYITEKPDSIVSERVRIQIANHQAEAALAQRDLERFVYYFQIGASGARALNSPKRKQEAIENWRAACKVWPNEERIMQLAELLF